MDLERARIFRLLETADNFVKYARPGREARAAARARERYESALELARARGDAGLLEQVRLRLSDLDRRAGTAADPGPLGSRRTEDGHDFAREPAVLAASQGAEARATSVGAPRVPPGQRVTSGWPVLHEGSIPRFDKQTWRLGVDGACNHPYELTFDELRALPAIDLRSDFHCVTGWSKLDNLWRGVQTKLLIDEAEPATDASHVVVHDEQGYTANLPMGVLMEDDAIVTWAHDGRGLAPEHGGPLRLLVPRLYGWKSVKWVRRFEVLRHDQRGFWEIRGYHNRADPWREERYAYQEDRS